MNKQESKELIEKLQQRIQAFEIASEDLSRLIGYPSGEFGESVGYIVDMLVETTSIVIGDEQQWLSWFIYDCEFGEKPMEATVGGKEYLVDSIDVLLEVVSNSKDKNEQAII